MRSSPSPSVEEWRPSLRPSPDRLRLTYIGGPTALLEIAGVRLPTDPTFDPSDTEYRTPAYVLRKTQGPALAADALGKIDLVLLSHDHHFDNLDHAGRRVLEQADRIDDGRGRRPAGSPGSGLAPWDSRDVPARGGLTLRITATPARHGPADGDRGPVVGFALAFADAPGRCVYVSGDTVWYDGIAEVARRFRPSVAVLFTGAARVPEVGPAHLTFTGGRGGTDGPGLSRGRHRAAALRGLGALVGEARRPGARRMDLSTIMKRPNAVLPMAMSFSDDRRFSSLR